MPAVRVATPRAGPRGLANYYPPQTADLRPSLFLPARDFLASARIRGSYGYAYVVVNREANGNRIVRRETGGPPGGGEGYRQGHAEVVQLEGFHGEAGILRLLNCQLPL